MAKSIKDFRLEITKQGVTATGFVRYNIGFSDDPEGNKYKEFSFDVTGTDIIDDELDAIENKIKTDEGIS